MGGEKEGEKKGSKRFSKIRSVLRPRSRGPPNEANERTAAAPPRPSIVDSSSDPRMAGSDGSSAIPETPTNAQSVVAASTATDGPSTSDAPGNTSRSQSAAKRNHFVVPSDHFGDRKATEERYKTAAKQLEDALKIRRANWKAFDIPTVSLDLSANDPIPQLREQIISALETRRNLVENRDFWAKGKNIVERTFTAMSPFAKNFLVIAQKGAAIPVLNPYGLLCGGLLLLITIADREIKGRNEIEGKLDYISRQLGQLEIIQRLPEVGVKTDQIVNRAMDVLSAALRYLAVHIRHESARLGIIENIITTVFKDDDERQAADTELRTSVEEFNWTLSHFGLSVGIQSYAVLEEVRQGVAFLREGHVPTFEATAFIDDKVTVPYERNAHFAGREKLLALLRSKLSETVPKEWNHRVALFGLGGIGKTQLALEYVYSSRGSYERIYWISAVNEATLLSGFQEIAGKSRCVPNYVALQPQETAKKVIDWLGTQDKWLLVIDNLDEITVADGYLPVRSPGKHTLITTRNPNCQHIPAEGLKVEELDVEDATELLLLRSGVETSSERRAEATNIVKELGCLPLAIEQAAAYIRETSRDILVYLPSYPKDRTRHHARKSEGIRAYYKNTVAATWRMSFEQIEKRNADASDLLRLLAYLNPDGILTEFLEAGASDASDGTVRDVISDHDRFYAALGELERFSVIGRQDDAVKGQRIIIHRLVQSVVKTQMSDVLRQAIERSLTNLCNVAFPPEDYGSAESRTLSRRFQDQVVMPILAIDVSSPELGHILWRVGSFLLEDGKYQQAVDVLTKTVETRKMVSGIESQQDLSATLRLARGYDGQGRSQDALTLRQNVVNVYMRLYGEQAAATLDAMLCLSSSYYVLGRWKEAIILEEKVLNGERKLYGIEDRHTLLAMLNLAETYRRLGRFEESVELGGSREKGPRRKPPSNIKHYGKLGKQLLGSRSA